MTNEPSSTHRHTSPDSVTHGADQGCLHGTDQGCLHGTDPGCDHDAGQGHHHDEGVASLDPVSYWEDLYADAKWSGRVNAALEHEVASLPPRRALDLGCGEGADALWLAARGWSVTAVDISARALARGATQAEQRGLTASIRWVEADLAIWQPDSSFDLVASSFLHSPVDFPREQVLRRAAAAVAPGGVLLVVGHGEPPPWSAHRHDGQALPTPDDVLATLALDPAAWEVLTSAMIAREADGPDGAHGTLVDSVLTVRRRA